MNTNKPAPRESKSAKHDENRDEIIASIDEADFPPYDGAPTIEQLSSLAAAAGETPEEALRIWSRSALVLRNLRTLPAENQAKLLEIFAYKKHWNFEDLVRDQRDAWKMRRLTIEEAMTALGVKSVQTLEKIIFRMVRGGGEYDTEEKALSAVKGVISGKGIPAAWIKILLRVKRQINSETALAYSKNAKAKRHSKKLRKTSVN